MSASQEPRLSGGASGFCQLAQVRRGVGLSLPRSGDGWPHRIYI